LFDLKRVELLSFDCYGTMIDWETGILRALCPVLRAHGQTLDERAILGIYGEIEHVEQQGEFQPYRQVLGNVVRRFGERLGFAPSQADVEALANSLGNWTPFPDTVAALRRLQRRYKLAVISNTDDELFAESARHLPVQFADVITAEQARAYKPSLRVFELAMSRLKVEPERWLHVGQSVYHDVVPAKSVGLGTALVYRRGAGATPDVHAEPDLRLPDLESLASAAEV
jgi:2-haloacid dehalogenase